MGEEAAAAAAAAVPAAPSPRLPSEKKPAGEAEGAQKKIPSKPPTPTQMPSKQPSKPPSKPPTPIQPPSKPPSRQGSRPGSRQVSRPGSSAGVVPANRPASRQEEPARPATVIAMSSIPIPEEGPVPESPAVISAREQAQEQRRPGTADSGKPGMLDQLLKGHHRFDGTGWKQLCDSYNAQALSARKNMQKELKSLDQDRERERTKEALAEAIEELKVRVSSHRGRRHKLAAMLRENDQTWRETLVERRTRSQRQSKPPALPRFGGLTPNPGEEAPSLSETAESGFASVARSTPWSEYRALTDRPSREDQMRRQRMYREMLDEQVAEKKAFQTRQKQADRDLERTTNTSLYSPSHVWEERPWERYVDLDSQRYKNDLLRAKTLKETREKTHLQSEREEYSTWVTSEMKRSAEVMAKAEKKRLTMNEKLVESWDRMVQRKADRRSAQRQEELTNDKNLLGGTFRICEERTKLLRKPRPASGVFGF